MEAFFASCSGEFQSIRSAQAQQAATSEGLKSAIAALAQKLHDLDYTITQQLPNFGHRTSALEARPTGAQPASAGGVPNPVGQPLASAGVAATGVGDNSGDSVGGWQQTWGPQ
eukprot:9515863-Alexandrium_andersonii.AAC.1